MKNIELVVPKLEDYYYEKKLEEDPKTMGYNAGYDVCYDGYHYETGCIDFPKNKWKECYENRIKENKYFAYIKDNDINDYIGYVNYQYNKSENIYECGVLIEYKYRGKGYSKEALKLLVLEARKNNIDYLYDTFEIDRGNTLNVFKSIGFEVVNEKTWKKFGKEVKGVTVRIDTSVVKEKISIKKLNNEESLTNNIQEHFIIKYENQEIGFVKIYKFNNDINLKYLNEYKNIYEFEIFIEDKKYLSEEYSKTIIEYISDYIYIEYNVDSIVVRTLKNNQKIIKYYEKCNYKKIYEYSRLDTINTKEDIVVMFNYIDKWKFAIDNDELIELVLNGKKTATTSNYDKSELPIIGSKSIIRFDNDTNACIVKTVDYKIMKFSQMTEELAKLEGEGDLSLEYWKNVHYEFFKSYNKNFDDDTKVVFEIFEVAYKRR